MEEMLREEIEAALDNTDDPEAQAYALRLGLEQMSNMKKNVQTVQEEIRKDMDKNKRAIEQITKELIAFRAARKAQVCALCPSICLSVCLFMGVFTWSLGTPGR